MTVDEILCKLTAKLFSALSTRGSAREQLTVWDLNVRQENLSKAMTEPKCQFCQRVNASELYQNGMAYISEHLWLLNTFFGSIDQAWCHQNTFLMLRPQINAFL